MNHFHFTAAILLFIVMATSAVGADEYVLVLEKHIFTPRELELPANKKIKLIIKNQDDTAAEFESTDLNREKVVGGKKEISVFIGPLDPGTYAFFDEFHRETATGTIVVKKP